MLWVLNDDDDDDDDDDKMCSSSEGSGISAHLRRP